jgi:hypothetical protein
MTPKTPSKKAASDLVKGDATPKPSGRFKSLVQSFSSRSTSRTLLKSNGQPRSSRFGSSQDECDEPMPEPARKHQIHDQNLSDGHDGEEEESNAVVIHLGNYNIHPSTKEIYKLIQRQGLEKVPSTDFSRIKVQKATSRSKSTTLISQSSMYSEIFRFECLESFFVNSHYIK